MAHEVRVWSRGPRRNRGPGPRVPTCCRVVERSRAPSVAGQESWSGEDSCLTTVERRSRKTSSAFVESLSIDRDAMKLAWWQS
jgi:hypothetical protein